jgi:hypothetical protein
MGPPCPHCQQPICRQKYGRWRASCSRSCGQHLRRRRERAAAGLPVDRPQGRRRERERQGRPRRRVATTTKIRRWLRRVEQRDGRLSQFVPGSAGLADLALRAQDDGVYSARTNRYTIEAALWRHIQALMMIGPVETDERCETTPTSWRESRRTLTPAV